MDFDATWVVCQRRSLLNLRLLLAGVFDHVSSSLSATGDDEDRENEHSWLIISWLSQMIKAEKQQSDEAPSRTVDAPQPLRSGMFGSPNAFARGEPLASPIPCECASLESDSEVDSSTGPLSPSTSGCDDEDDDDDDEEEDNWSPRVPRTFDTARILGQACIPHSRSWLAARAIHRYASASGHELWRQQNPRGGSMELAAELMITFLFSSFPQLAERVVVRVNEDDNGDDGDSASANDGANDSDSASANDGDSDNDGDNIHALGEDEAYHHCYRGQLMSISSRVVTEITLRTAAVGSSSSHGRQAMNTATITSHGAASSHFADAAEEMLAVITTALHRAIPFENELLAATGPEVLLALLRYQAGPEEQMEQLAEGLVWLRSLSAQWYLARQEVREEVRRRNKSSVRTEGDVEEEEEEEEEEKVVAVEEEEKEPAGGEDVVMTVSLTPTRGRIQRIRSPTAAIPRDKPFSAFRATTLTPRNTPPSLSSQARRR